MSLTVDDESRSPEEIDLNSLQGSSRKSIVELSLVIRRHP